VLGRDLANAIDGRWADYLRLCREGAIYSASVRLGEIANCLRFAQLASDLASKWSGALKRVTMSPDMIQAVREEARTKAERLGRMLHGDSSMTYEEMLLLITIRVELEMLFAFLAERRIGDLPDLSSLDADLSAAACSPKNAAAYVTAQESARKNWGLPLRSEWLGTDAIQ
jgi:hypothetical protein